jgi:capsular polysaccharide biosynthesis protein
MNMQLPIKKKIYVQSSVIYATPPVQHVQMDLLQAAHLVMRIQTCKKAVKVGVNVFMVSSGMKNYHTASPVILDAHRAEV